jgi:beta-galactosidase/beta-glucuronidase
MKHTKSYIKGYPRPSFVRNDFQILDGKWAFKFDDQRIGDKDRWYLGLSQNTEIIVPYAYQTELSGIKDTKQHEVVWYERVFDTNEKPITILHFDGSDYITKVWLNGIYLGSNEGGYHRFSFDVSSQIKNKDNKLIVRVEDTFDTKQPRGKQRWKTENFGCWYVETTGIWKSVWLEQLNDVYLVNSEINTDFDRLTLSINYNVNKILKNMKLKIFVTYDDSLIASVTQDILKTNQNISFSIKTDDDQFKIKAWSPKDPNLYDIVYELYKDDQLIDIVKSYFAVRKWEAIGQGIYLNDQPVYLKMLLDQGYWPQSGLTAIDEDAFIHDINLTKEMGFNGIRKHQKIEDERFYYYCDIIGIFVWLEMPSAYEFDNQMISKVTSQWIKIIAQYRHYPSIMTYVLMNESWGVHHIKNNIEEQQFTLGLYEITKALDRTRFVISNDGWEHTKSDLITIHDYTSSGEELEDIYTHMNDILSNEYVNRNKVRSLFAKGFKYQGEPILISEYGGIALNNTDGWGYGDKVDSIESYLDRLSKLTYVIQSMPMVSGYCLTQTSDVEQETNGVLDHDHQPKTDVENIRKINGKR